ncbi:MAG: peptidase domain-containing ABC transporter [Alphaproteobacteria bacterium]
MFLSRKLPVILQTEVSECGLACTAMIARYWGHDIDLNILRKKFLISLNGASIKSIMMIAGTLQLATRPLRLDMEHLPQLQLPAILHWDMNHFVVLKALKNGQAHIIDPGVGLRIMPLSKVSQHFTGVALEMSPTAEFSPMEARLKPHLSLLWHRLVGLKRAIFQTLTLSIILQIIVLTAPFYLQWVVDGVLPRSDTSLLWALAIGFGGLAIIRAVAEATRSWAILIYGNQMSAQMVGNVFRHLIRLPTAYFEKRHVGDIISRMSSATPIQEALTQSVVAVLIDGIMATLMLVIMFLYAPILGVIVLISAILLICLTLIIYPHQRRTQEEAIYAKAIENTHVIESIRASTTVKLFGREAQREAAWRNLYTDVINANVNYGKFTIAQKFVETGLVGLQIILVVFAAAYLMMEDGSQFTVGMLLAFLAYRQYFTDSVTQLLQKGIEFRLLSLHLDRLSDIIFEDTEKLDDTENAARNIDGHVELRNVSFQYSDTDPWVIKDLSLNIPARSMTTLTGKSGGGKTTLMKLMLGLYEPTSGHISIDGDPLTDIGIRNWRQHIGVVMQDDKLLSGSIADNISFFDPEMDMGKVIRAAEAAKIHNEIMKIPMTYMSMVGDMGSILSGGQKQRVLLARALYHDPQVLFLDEGTANLDIETERQIVETILAMNITRIIVAHRPAFLEKSDFVLTI